MAIPNCARCRHRRLIVSENGCHYVCGLSWQNARRCISGGKSFYWELPKFAWGVDDDGK